MSHLAGTIGVIILLFALSSGYGQELEKEYVTKSFYATSLINMQTAEVIPLKQVKFGIRHRFGLADIHEDFLHEFMGLDKSSNIRFSFGAALTDRLYLSIGRTKYLKQYDLEGKYAILKQTTNNSTPLSLSVYANISYHTDRFPEQVEGFDYLHADSSTIFKYDNSHRLAYNYQLILGRKFTNWLSVQVAPQAIYRNLVPPGYDNLQVTLPVGIRFKFAMFSSVIAEYIPIVSGGTEFAAPWSLGYEVGTPGHTFQFFVCNSPNMMNQYLYSTETSRIRDGQFYFGFNIHRYLWIKQNTLEF